MCGIAGAINIEGVEERKIKNTLLLMKNRGPDNTDYKQFESPGFHVSLLHSRLSIIDLDNRANQPFSLDGCTLVFNGEIYNYLEIRHLLEDKGRVFQTNSDTEVLLQSYLYWGKDCVDRFEGMWSFAIFDQRKNEVFLSRDRFAEKPLYYYQAKDQIIFGSEVKYIQSLLGSKLKINDRHICRYLVNGYRSLYKTDDTFFHEIKELPYSSNLTIDSTFSLHMEKYWKPAFKPIDMSMKDAIDGFRERLLESIQLRLRADVPLAFCLSGGVDSASILSIAAKYYNADVASFSLVSQDERYNERENIEATIKDLGCKHSIIEIPQDGFFERLRSLVSYHDAPLYTASYYIHSFLSEAMSEQGYKVSFSGTAADELVTGYYDHFNMFLYETRESPNYANYLSDWEQGIGSVVRNPHLKNPELYFNNPKFRDHIYLNNHEFSQCLTNQFAEEFTEYEFTSSLLRNRMMNELFYEGSRTILHEDDLNSMYYSIENRSPYLDRNLFEFSYSIPTEYLIQQGFGKYVLREAVNGILNDKVRLDQRKVGFNTSIQSLIDFTDKSQRELFLSDSTIFQYVEKDKIENLINQENLPNSYSKFLFNFINSKIFMELNA